MPITFVVIIVVLLSACVGLVVGKATSKPTPRGDDSDAPKGGRRADRLAEELEAASAQNASAKAQVARLQAELTSLRERPEIDPAEVETLRGVLTQARKRERAQSAQVMAAAQEMAALRLASEEAVAQRDAARADNDVLRDLVAETQERLVALATERAALLEGGGGAAALRRKVESLLATQAVAVRRASQLEAELASSRRQLANRAPDDDGRSAEVAVSSAVSVVAATTANGHAPSKSVGPSGLDLGDLPEVGATNVLHTPVAARHALEGDEPDIDLVP